MLGRLLLILIQLGVGWFLGPLIATKLPDLGAINIFVYGAIFAIIVWCLGFLASVVLKDVGQPSSRTLTFALIGGLIGAGLTMLPPFMDAVGTFAQGIPTMGYPLIGAVLGYQLKR